MQQVSEADDALLTRNQAKFDGNYTSDEEGEAALQKDLAEWLTLNSVRAPPVQPMTMDGPTKNVAIALAAKVLVNPDITEDEPQQERPKHV